ncbi:glycosyltransferase family A protein [Sulfurimonas sp.]|uniref:glycosyltransferase family 2 protein n=1 Tax=Sulfurimonas sp. TaxID=2022749 RepID=UPI0025CED2EE|nr:glycosyltransferase family A protein [Sulfurimonas sp.]
MDVSVVIPTYNRYEVLKRALKSVYAQTHKPKEVIIIDDGSTDKTSQILKTFPDAKYYYQKNSGVSSARNLGIKKSNFEWIAFLDSDDEWHPQKLQEHLKLHQKCPKLQISYTDEKWIRNLKEVKIPKKYRKVGGDIFEECLSHCFIAPSSTIIHKNLLSEVGLFDESLEVCEDYDLWLRVAMINEIGLVDKKLITKYGGDADQLSMKFWGMDRFRVKSLEKLLKISNSKEELINNTLIEKYSLLLTGAQKHDKIQEIKIYEKKIEDLKS